MRNIVCGATIVVGVLVVAFLVGRQPLSATPLQFKANDIVEVRTLEATIDMKALPR